jgi:hypothetical protein
LIKIDTTPSPSKAIEAQKAMGNILKVQGVNV